VHGKLLPKAEETVLRRQKLCEYWYNSDTTIQFIFCQVCLVVVSLVFIITHPPLPTPCVLTAGILAENSSRDRQTDGKGLVWFGEIERKLAKLSMTTFAYRSSS
jgi:hypothetical protein